MIPLNLDAIINAISGIASPLIKDKLQRNETVIKSLNGAWAPNSVPLQQVGLYFPTQPGGLMMALTAKKQPLAL